MNSEFVDIKTPDGICDSYIAYPSDGERHPAVLFYMDAFGVRKYLYEMANKIAERGYFVLLPNLFYRSRRVPVLDAKFPLKAEEVSDVFKQIMPMIRALSPEKAMRDAGVFLNFLAEQKQVESSKVAITGYCMGGRLAILTAANYPDRISAVASFHAGNLVTDAEDSPHRLLKKIRAELYIGYADKDRSMTADQIKEFEKALSEADCKYESELYPGAAHGFTMADLPAYNEDALKKHWEKLFGLLERAN